MPEEVIAATPVASAGGDREPIDWGFQERAVASAVRALNEYPRTTIVAACGSGKSKVGAKIVAERIGHIEGSHTLILAPNLDLLTQLIAEYEEQLPPSLLGSIVAVCSELRVDADAVSHTDLQARDIEVTTSASRLAELLAAPGRFTVFATYASQLTIRSAHRHCGLKRWNFALIDEAHRSAGAVDREWSTILHDRDIPCDERLFATATPRIISREGTVSMDDAKVFGRICFEFTAEHARQAGVQATPRVLVPVLADKDVYALTAGALEDAPHFSVHESLAMDPGKLAVQIAVLKAAREYGLTRLISFHSRIPDARAWSRTLQHANTLLPEDEQLAAVTGLHISGQHKPAQRTAVYNRLKSSDAGLVVVSNAKVMGEGVNVPNVDGVVFVDPKNSFEAVVQAVGRALRTNGDRHKVATIIVPVLLAEGQTPESALEGSAFNTVWSTLCALAAHDVAFRGQLAHHRFELGHSDEAATASITLPDWLTFTGAAVPEGFAEAISVRAVRMTTDAWEERLGKVARYHERTGHLLPTVVEDPVFHGWLNMLRYQKADGKLPKYKEEALDKYGMVWDVDAYYIGEAIKELKKLGTLQVPKDATFGNPPRNLHNWRYNFNQAFDAGKFTEDQLAQLARLGLTRPPRRPSWDEWFAMLEAHANSSGSMLVNSRVMFTDAAGVERTLGKWVMKQLKLLEADKLEPDQAERLKPYLAANAVKQRPATRGNKPPSFDEWIAICTAYKKATGDTDPRHDTVFTHEGREYKVGTWWTNRRYLYLNDKCSQPQKQKLEAVGLRLTPSRPSPTKKG